MTKDTALFIAEEQVYALFFNCSPEANVSTGRCGAPDLKAFERVKQYQLTPDATLQVL